MGSSLQRIEVLLIGLVLLIAGAVVVGVTVLRPASPTAYVQATPQPIVTGGGVRPTSAPLTASTSTTASIPTAVPVATAPLAATSVPSATATSIATIAPSATAAPPATSVRPPPPMMLLVVKTVWPWLLLSLGVGGLAIVMVRMRKQRMTYTNQSVGQLLAAADDVTRQTNVRIMRGLAEQGLLTAELAAAAGIDLRQPRKQLSLLIPHLHIPRLRMPRLRVPALRMPAVHMPRPWLSRCRQRSITIDQAPACSRPMPPATLDTDASHDTTMCEELGDGLPASMVPPVPMVAAPKLARGLGLAALPDTPNPTKRVAALRGVLAAQATELPVVAPPLEPDAHIDDVIECWTAEDRVLAVASVFADIWAAAELHSPILAFDTASTIGNDQVIVTIDTHPDEEERLVDLPDLVSARRPAWRAAWRRTGGSPTTPPLVVDVVTNSTRPPAGGPLLAPILAHGRGGKMTRFFPLASWRHLGLYGGSALGVLHAILGSLLYNQPPSHVALAIIDHGEIAPLYRDVAHLVSLPSSMRESIEILAQAIKHGGWSEVRPLVLVVVEPNDMLLNRLLGIAARLRAKPATPVHLLIVQEHLSMAGRELYAMLPAVITSGGRGPTALLPGQGDWPRRTEARLIGRSLRLDGRAITLDEADIATVLAQLRGKPTGLLPVIWDAPETRHSTISSMRTALDASEADLLAEDNQGGDVEHLATQEPIAGAEPIRTEEGYEDKPRLEEQIATGGLDDDQVDGETQHQTPLAADDGDAKLRRLTAALVAARQRLVDDHLPRIADSAPAVAKASANMLPERTDELPAQADAHEQADEAIAVAPIIDPLMSVVPIIVTEKPEADDQPRAIVPLSVQNASTAAPVVDPTDQDATRLAPSPDIAAVADAPTPTLLVTSANEQTDSLLAPTAEPAAVSGSRRAALLRSTLEAGQADAPALQMALPRGGDLLAATATPTPIDRPPAERDATPQPMVEPENGWPIGPAPLGRVAMAELMARVASAPTIIAGQANELGVTKNRLVELLKGTHKAHAKELAEWLMVWLDLAGVLVEPTRAGRLRHPRALVTTNLAEIATQLNATSCPDKATVKNMWALSNEVRD